MQRRKVSAVWTVGRVQIFPVVMPDLYALQVTSSDNLTTAAEFFVFFCFSQAP